MPQSPGPVRWVRASVAVSASVAIAWIAFVAHREVPLLDQFDLAVHETGHLVTAFLPRLVMFIAGSAAQVLFPLAMAAYFWFRRGEAAAAGFCLAWTGSSARDVSIYTADAVSRSLPLIGGGEHDWAYILGAGGFDALEHTAEVARFIEISGMVCALGGIAVAALSALPTRGAHRVAAGEGERAPSDVDLWAAAASLPFKHEHRLDAGVIDGASGPRSSLGPLRQG